MKEENYKYLVAEKEPPIVFYPYQEINNNERYIKNPSGPAIRLT